MYFLYFVPALAVIGLEVVFVYKATGNRRRVNMIVGTPITKAAELGFGPAKVQRRVVAFSGLLVAPLSGRPCVHYCFKVEEKRTVRHGPHGASSHWKTVIDDTQSVACGVDDGTGVASLDLRGADLADRCQSVIGVPWLPAAGL